MLQDNHLFYKSSFIIDSNIGQSYWVDMSARNDVTTNNMLSQSHRRAAVSLIYQHNNVTNFKLTN